LADVQSCCESLGVSSVVIEADLSVESALVDVAAALRALPGDVSVLVNNVGGRPPPSLPSSPVPCFAEYNDGENHSSYFKFNVLPPASLTHLLIEGMVERDKGYVLNVASFNGLAPCPLIACYSACKAYIVAWSAAIDVELKGRGSKVKVDVVCPGPVATDGIGMAGRATSRIADPDAFAEQALSLATTRHVRVPWPAHCWNLEMYSSQSHFVPEFLSERWLWKAIMLTW
jgi:short-subunit dehydrogenase